MDRINIKGEFMFEYISHNEEETKKIATALASKLETGDIVVLSGDLGSGKTKFTEGFLSFWGLEDEISSPTFTIVNEHFKDNTNIYHLDVYRLADMGEFYAIGGMEYFTTGICVIEWGELIEDILPKNYIKVSFSKDNENESIRYLNFKAYGERLQNVIKELEL
jgi:tRNA threonylcarbamoyladenosine biosynthesis protein TsaE